jgi:hypothetical protein
MRKVLAISFLAALLCGSAAAPASGVSTAWQNFGTGTATWRHATPSQYLTVTSATRRNPEAVQLVITGTGGQPLTLNWQINCWGPGTLTAFSTGFANPTLPYTLTDFGFLVDKYSYCQVEVEVSRSASGTVNVKLKLQATYPAS